MDQLLLFLLLSSLIVLTVTQRKSEVKKKHFGYGIGGIGISSYMTKRKEVRQISRRENTRFTSVINAMVKKGLNDDLPNYIAVDQDFNGAVQEGGSVFG